MKKICRQEEKKSSENCSKNGHVWKNTKQKAACDTQELSVVYLCVLFSMVLGVTIVQGRRTEEW